MSDRQQYIKRANQSVVAVPLALDTDGFTYHKWGDTQRCKPGDWIVNNDGDIYTVDHESFARTYRAVGTGTYVKVSPVWVEVAPGPGSVETKEGVTHYRAGDFLVFNEEHGGDPYAVTAEKFEAMYERNGKARAGHVD